jgi:hypothetical protein
MGDKLEMLIAKQVNRANIKGRMVSWVNFYFKT